MFIFIRCPGISTGRQKGMNKSTRSTGNKAIYSNWQCLEWREADQLHLAAEEIRQACQFPALVAHCFLPLPRNIHDTDLEWDDPAGCLVSRLIGGAGPFRISLRIMDLVLSILPEKDPQGPSFQLTGRTRIEIFQWIRWKLTQLGYPGDRLSLHLPYSNTQLVLKKYEPLDFKKKTHLAEMRRYFSNNSLLLTRFDPSNGWTLDPPRCHPADLTFSSRVLNHHGEMIREAGLAHPGENCNEPHFFIRFPASGALPASGFGSLPAGCRLVEEDQPSLLLPGSELSHLKTADEQVALMLAFLEAGFSV